MAACWKGLCQEPERYSTSLTDEASIKMSNSEGRRRTSESATSVGRLVNAKRAQPMLPPKLQARLVEERPLFWRWS